MSTLAELHARVDTTLDAARRALDALDVALEEQPYDTDGDGPVADARVLVDRMKVLVERADRFEPALDMCLDRHAIRVASEALVKP
jgi:glutathione S-transferase